jgi:hypothetical protein
MRVDHEVPVNCRRSPQRLLFGSTADRVMQAATSLVLSTRADDNAKPGPLAGLL